jgi:catechol 2,3-dioxygenase-like lactoylglutathione lyase family enzyme
MTQHELVTLCARPERVYVESPLANTAATIAQMRVLGLNHVNIAGSHELIERCRAFYVGILGLTDGHRPSFRSRGYWLYAGDHPVVHLTERSSDMIGKSALDHYAFTCEGLDGMMERLRERGIPFTIDPARDSKNAQLFVEDPAGVSLELNFL